MQLWKLQLTSKQGKALTDLLFLNLSLSIYDHFIQQLPYPNYRKDYFNSTVAGFLPLLLTLAFIYTAMMIVKVGHEVCLIKMIAKSLSYLKSYLNIF
jgi:hypothetical protein